MMSPSFDVIVVGAGLVGLACANALVKEGFRATVVEAGTHIPELPKVDAPFDPRVVALTRASEQFLTQLGIWGALPTERLCAYQTMRVWDITSNGNIEFSAQTLFEPNLGHIVENQLIMSHLYQALQSEQVAVFHGEKIAHFEQHAKWCELKLSSGQRLTAQLVIAADGAESALRKLCQIESKQGDYQQSAVVAVVQGEHSHDRTAFQRFAPTGPLALLPLADPLQSVLVWSTTPDKAQKLCQLPMSEFSEEVARESQAVMGKMQLLSKRFTFPLRTHHAKQYAVPRCVLVGDAAHTLHPLAGQGVNLGFLDVATLVPLLAQAKKQQRAYGNLTLLRRYERERKMHNQMMIWAMEFFKRGFGTQQPIIQHLRNSGLNWVDGHQSVKQIFAKIALGKLSPFPWLKGPAVC